MTKAQRKIEETKSRTTFILQVKKDSKDRKLEKMKQVTRKAAQHHQVHALYEKRKTRDSSTLYDRRKSMYQKKQDEARKLKEERKVLINFV